VTDKVEGESGPPVDGSRRAAAWREFRGREFGQIAILGLVCGGGALAFVGTFMTWIRGSGDFIGHYHRSGMNGDGRYIAVMATVVMACGLWLYRHPGRLVAQVTLAATIALLIASIYESHETSSTANELANAYFGYATVGRGVWVLVSGSTVAVIGALCAAWRVRGA
jgi:hypothetical protein